MINENVKVFLGTETAAKKLGMISEKDFNKLVQPKKMV